MPKQIPMNEKREWLAENDKGKPAAEIARGRKRGIKVIKRGIEEARAERDGAAARAEIVKEALLKHQQQLMGIINRLLNATEPLPPDTEIRREKNGAIAPLPIPAGRIEHKLSEGLTVTLSDEGTTLWRLLKQHLSRDRVWSAIRNWKEALKNRTKAILDLERAIKTLIEIETGLDVTEDEPVDTNKAFFIHPRTDRKFFIVSIRNTMGIPDGTNLREYIVATEDGFVRLGEKGQELAYCPGKQKECREALLRVLDKIPSMPEIKKVNDAENELNRVGGKLKIRLEEINLMGLIPGRCPICSRISL